MKLCSVKPSNRYKLKQVMAHPWITRNFESQIPRTVLEENLFMHEVDNKLRNVQLFLIVSLGYKYPLFHVHSLESQGSKEIDG